jgi:2-polyprenyl-6-methoxyphenol hydroxylase-like FAD-dependent oxidoreductase
MVVGGGQVGCGTGLDPAQRDHQVAIVEMAREMAPDANLMQRRGLPRELE